MANSRTQDRQHRRKIGDTYRIKEMLADQLGENVRVWAEFAGTQLIEGKTYLELRNLRDTTGTRLLHRLLNQPSGYLDIRRLRKGDVIAFDATIALEETAEHRWLSLANMRDIKIYFGSNFENKQEKKVVLAANKQEKPINPRVRLSRYHRKTGTGK